MFDTPEYASYVQLCRELPLERWLQAGDYYANLWADFHRWEVKLTSQQQVGWIKTPDLKEAGGTVWLPRLDQWLTMLEEANIPNIGFWAGDDYGKCGVLLLVDDGEGIEYGDLETAATREEAAARLWVAVSTRIRV